MRSTGLLASGLLLLSAALAPALAQQYVISTYAGGAPLPTPIPAREVSIGAPTAVTADGAGNIYFISLDSIFKLDRDGIIIRVAGNSRQGDFGDGGPAAMAQLRLPFFASGVFANGMTALSGNLFIADRGNNRVRKISADGIITTVAGSGTEGFSGDGGPATSAQLNSPTGIAADAAGNLFIADWGNSRVRKVSPDGIITTVAGAGGCCGSFDDGIPATRAQLGGPVGLALDTSGNLFIADYSHNRIRKVSPDGIITTVADPGVQEFSGDHGPAAGPVSVSVDDAGNLFIAYSGISRIRKVSPNGMSTTFAGGGATGPGDGGPAVDAQLNSPQGVAVDRDGNVYVADTFDFRIRKISQDGMISTVAGSGSNAVFSGDGGPATSAWLALGWFDPSPIGGVALDNEGNLFIADTGNQRVRKVSASGIITTVAGDGTPGYVGNNGEATSAQLNFPLDVAVDGAGDLLIADSENNRVRKVSRDGIITTIPGSDSDFGQPTSITVDIAGNLFITAGGRVRKISPEGDITIVAGGGTLWDSSSDGQPATEAKLFFLCGVAADTAGNLFIADCNDRAHKVSPNGIITTVALPGGSPTGVAVDHAGNAFFSTSGFGSDMALERIYKVSPDGTVTAIAGTGSIGYSGDDGPALRAQLSGPAGLAVDAAGNIYFADTGNGAVRVLRPLDGPSGLY
jgi:sugar lactone lactonase YvrE